MLGLSHHKREEAIIKLLRGVIVLYHSELNAVFRENLENNAAEIPFRIE
jgi:hypothetical protein